ncbi:hypothetical protein K458DRAFT_61833 [Lentithecium fluviatile CBS 122367]|uniref:DUF7730 domain-containing protein n=1 Tax=Lentithecium fluviatile CBS 122367 TaxID=1168545 RepID=A0A6G1JJH0_9PLEO|nr:hypothetical protein K458DRAFT_61833 [Lentithecium fluviatile CBS 122367]
MTLCHSLIGRKPSTQRRQSKIVDSERKEKLLSFWIEYSSKVLSKVKSVHSRPRSNCQLLNLPPELRMRIWFRAIAGMRIALYRDNGHLTHGILDDNNTRTPGKLFMVWLGTIDQILNDLLDPQTRPGESIWDARERKAIMKKVKLTALLRTCRSIYSEAIDLLYSGNVFIILQNPTLNKLHSSIPSQNFARIRSLHIHWQNITPAAGDHRDNRPNQLDFLDTNLEIVTSMPHLQNLSIFVQGPLGGEQTYLTLLGRLGEVAAKAAPQFYVVRLPRSLNISWQLDDLMAQDFGILAKNYGFQLCFVPLEAGRDPISVADREGGGESGWRVGAFFEPAVKPEHGFAITNYAVYTPLDLEEIYGVRLGLKARVEILARWGLRLWLSRQFS